jgi:outer membrane lipase/esterase
MWTERLFPALHSINAPGALGRNVNFAYGAATTGENTFGAGDAGELPAGVKSQVDAYLALRASGAIAAPGANAYAFIEAGPNDYFAALVNGENLAATAAASPARLADSARRLAAAGIRTIFVTETPDFSDAPLFIDAGFAPAARDALRSVAASSRTHLRAELSRLQAQLGDQYRIVVLPVNALFRAIVAQPAAFGFTNVTGKIYDDTTDSLLERDPAKRDGYLFVDSLHTTAKAQAWQARYYSEVIGAIDGTVQRRFARVSDALRHDAELMLHAADEAMTGPSSPDRWTWFVTARGGAAWGSVEPSAGPGWRADTLGSLVGAKRDLTSSWTLGLALGTFTENGRLSPKTLRWDNEGEGVWLLNTWRLDPVTVRLTLGASKLSTEFTRDPSIPTFLARADTDGSLWSSRFEVERDFGALLHGIDASVVLGTTMVRSRVDSFNESGATGLNLRVAGIQRDTIRSDAGLRLRAASFSLGHVKFQPSADFLAVYEGGDRTTDVTAQLLDNSALPVREAVANGPRLQGQVRFTLGVAFTERLHAQISDIFEANSSDHHTHRVELGVTARF